MIPNSLIQATLVIVFGAAAIGQLPELINQVRRAQLILIQESKASKWGTPLLLHGNSTQRGK